MIKTLSLSLIPIIGSVSPVVTNETIYNKTLNTISSNYEDKGASNIELNSIIQGIKENSNTYTNLTNEVYQSILKEGKINENTLKKITHFQNILLNTNLDEKQKSWTQWWGANLWVNLTKKETNHYLNILYPYRNVSNIFDISANTMLNLTTAIDEFLRNYPLNDKLSGLLAMASLSLTLTGWTISGANQFFNYYNIKNIASKGNGVISFRFTFGFIFSGILPGYKVK